MRNMGLGILAMATCLASPGHAPSDAFGEEEAIEARLLLSVPLRGGSTREDFKPRLQLGLRWNQKQDHWSETGMLLEPEVREMRLGLSLLESRTLFLNDKPYLPVSDERTDLNTVETVAVAGLVVAAGAGLVILFSEVLADKNNRND